MYVTGTSEDAASYKDYTTIKYSSAGVQKWIARYNGPLNYWDEARAMKVDNAACVYVTGWSGGQYTPSVFATVKYDSTGAEQWTARFRAPANIGARATTLAIDNISNVYVAGFSWTSSFTADYVTVKYNSYGIQQWEALYDGPDIYWDWDQVASLVLDGQVMPM